MSHVALQAAIHRLLPIARSGSEFMRLLIDEHARQIPEGDWQPFYDLPYDQELAELSMSWFPELMRNEPPADVPVAGLFFGIFLPVMERLTVADFYVAGAREFKLSRAHGWAVQPAYFPEDRYAGSSVLASIYLLTRDKPALGHAPEQYLCLGYVAYAVTALLDGINPELIIGIDEPVGVAVGWDAGDPLYVGFFGPDGLRLRDPDEAIADIERWKEEFQRWFEANYGKRR